MSSNVIKAKYCFIAPLRINDWKQFSQEFGEKDKGWSRSCDANEYSLKEQIVDFLGMGKENSSPIVAPGEKWTREVQKSGNKAFAYYKGIIKLYCEKKEEVQDEESGGNKTIRVLRPLTKCNESLVPDLVLDLYISPNRKSALAVMSLSMPDGVICDLEAVINTNYRLHKTDVLYEGKMLGTYQAPLLFMKTGYDKTAKKDIYEYREESLTLAHLLRAALPASGFELENVARFYTATFAQIDASTEVDDSELTTELVYLGQSKDYSYEVSSCEKEKVIHLFENIWTYSSLEGFACVVKRHGESDPDFITNSQSTFEKSYLPLFLTTLMADMSYTVALRHLDSIASDPAEQDRLREARLAVALSVSHYDHLNRLMKSLVENRDLETKYVAIQSSIDNRRLQLEKDRINWEESRDRRINYLLGFIGIGQVIFAILQLLGANNVMGNCVANSMLLNISSIVLLVVFTGLIFYLLIKLFTRRNTKTIR